MKIKHLLIGIVIIISVVLGAFSHSLNLSAQEGPKRDLLNLEQEHPEFTAPYFRIGLKQAWEIFDQLQPDVQPIVIGIIDTGIDAEHPEFSGEIINSELKGNVDLGQTPGVSLSDPDGHGTSVSGIIGANNISFFRTLALDEPDMNGVIGGAKIDFPYTLEVRTLPDDPSSVSGIFEIIFQIHELSQQGATVMNFSWGFDRPNYTPIKFLLLTGVLGLTFSLTPDIIYVVAAGNIDEDTADGTPDNLGNLLDNLTVVGGTDVRLIDDTEVEIRASFSNHGDGIALAAPAVDIYAPVPSGSGNFPPGTRNYLTTNTGNSFAAPFVTGVAALIKAINPKLTPLGIKRILQASADPIDTGEPDKPLGSGCSPTVEVPQPTGCRLNAKKAVELTLGLPTVPAGFRAELFAIIPGALELAFAPAGFGDFEGNLFVSGSDTIPFTGKISRVTQEGEVSTFVAGIPVNATIGGVGLSDLAVAFGNGRFGNDLFINNQGLGFIGKGEVLRVKPDGTRSTFVSGLNLPTGLAFDTTGRFGDDLFVADVNFVGIERILRIRPDGSISTLTTITPDGTHPNNIVFDTIGNFGGDLFSVTAAPRAFVTDFISRITPTGVVSTFVTNLGDFATSSSGLAFDNVGTFGGGLFLARTGFGEIIIMKPDGTFTPFVTNLAGPQGLAFDKIGNLFIVDGNRIIKISPIGE